MGAMTSQITNLTIVYLTVYSGADQRKHQSSASLAYVRRIHTIWKKYYVMMQNVKKSSVSLGVSRENWYVAYIY